jgi:hypothetical protein
VLNGEAERIEVMSLWKAGLIFLWLLSFFVALQEYLSQNCEGLFSSSGSFSAVVQRVEVCEAAIVFHLDCKNLMSIMRNAVTYACEHHSFREFEITKGLSPYELTRLVHIPNITHSTFVRSGFFIITLILF